MSELSLVTRDEIMAELGRRYDGVVLVTCKEIEANKEQRECDFQGFPTRAIGLAHAAVAYLTEHLKERVRYIDSEQED